MVKCRQHRSKRRTRGISREDTMTLTARIAVLGLSSLMIVGNALAQDRPAADTANYPSQTVRLIVPFPAGGPADIVARLLAQKLNESWGQPVIVENRPGANTVLAAQQVARAAPDGHTILVAIDSTLVMNPYLYKSLPYDPSKDFAPITQTTQSMSVLAVRAEDGPKTVKELIARAKAEPGKLNYGGGTLTPQLMGYVFNKAAGIQVQYVPFRGTPATVQGMLTKSVDMVYAATSIALPLVANGKLRALARLDSRNFPAVKDIPTLREAAGFAEFDDLSVWLGLVAPKATPKPIIDKIHREVLRILNDPPVKERVDRSGNYINTSKSPEEFGAFIRKEADRWSRVLPETGIRYD
ncbi:MAG: tripartite tricarboxylate transporter substrate binding protein [Rhizobiales bacterium]|nr:tripartite tricarboxylate transporter substrate binding protein [Hyphomicrobiales bacterium]